MVCGEFVAVLTMVAVPLRVPAVVGSKMALKLADCPAAEGNRKGEATEAEACARYRQLRNSDGVISGVGKRDRERGAGLQGEAAKI